MKDSIMCCAFCIGLGMVVGGVIASNNPKVRNWLRSVSSQASDTITEVKEVVEEKIQEVEKNNGRAQADKRN